MLWKCVEDYGKVMEFPGTIPWNLMEPDKTGRECHRKMWKDVEPSRTWNGKRWKEKEL